MKKRMQGFVSSLAIFLGWMVLTSAMLVVPTALTTNENEEAKDLVSQPGVSEDATSELVNSVPPPELPQTEYRQATEPEARE